MEPYRGSMASSPSVRDTHTLDHTLIEWAIMSSACNYRLYPEKSNLQFKKKRETFFFQLFWPFRTFSPVRWFRWKVKNNPLVWHCCEAYKRLRSNWDKESHTTLLTQRPSATVDRVIGFDRQHEDLANPPLRTCNPLENPLYTHQVRYCSNSKGQND